LNGLSTAYTNKAIVDPSGKIVLVNPQPGEIGTLGYSTVKGPSSIGLDMNLVKRFKLYGESTNFEFRLDAINILNHPNFGNPNTSINGNNTFGRSTPAFLFYHLNYDRSQANQRRTDSHRTNRPLSTRWATRGALGKR